MRKIIYFLIVVLIASCFVSCKKSKNKTFVSGMVYDTHSMLPVSNADIILEDFNMSSTLIINNEHEVLRLKSDNDGKFNLEYYPDVNYTNHSIRAEKTSECSASTLNSSIHPERKNYFKLRMVSQCHVLVHIKNVSPYDANDEMCYFRSPWHITNTTCYGFSFTGTNVDITQTVSSDNSQANQYLYFKWFVTKNNIENVYQDSIFMPSCDTVVYNLFY